MSRTREHTPAERLVDDGVRGLAFFQIEQNLFGRTLLDVVEVQLGQVLGAQPQEDGSESRTCGMSRARK